MKILLTNDDGFDASGLAAAKECLLGLGHEVLTIAPARQKSACSHSITLNSPLVFKNIDDKFYALDDGTPSDCVYLGLFEFFKSQKPDLVISGINHGSNLGEDITYSGTCAAAMEGALQGIKSIAFSQYYKGDSLNKFGFKLAVKVVKEILKNIENKKLNWGDREFLNVNIPAVLEDDFKGFKAVRAGKRRYDTKASVGVNPRGVRYFWLGEPDISYEAGLDSDLDAINAGFASLTPVKMDMTSYESLNMLRGLCE